MQRFLALVVLAALAALGACREEGTAEKVGRKFDEAIDEITRPNEGPLEKAGRKMDEAGEGAKEALEDAQERD